MFGLWLLSLSGKKGQRSYPGATQGCNSRGLSIAETIYRSRCPSRRTDGLNLAGGGISASFSGSPSWRGAGIVFQERTCAASTCRSCCWSVGNVSGLASDRQTRPRAGAKPLAAPRRRGGAGKAALRWQQPSGVWTSTLC